MACLLRILMHTNDLVKHRALLLHHFSPLTFSYLADLFACFLEDTDHNADIVNKSNLSLSSRILNLPILDSVFFRLTFQDFPHYIEERSYKIINMRWTIASAMEHHLLYDGVTLINLLLLQVPYLWSTLQIIQGIDNVFLESLDDKLLVALALLVSHQWLTLACVHLLV